jgi:prevent-host-death family protein
MESANVAEFKKHLSAYLEKVERGETVEICRRNIPIAHVIAVSQIKRNRTLPGCGEGTVTYLGNVTDPFMPEGNWEMLNPDDGKRDDGST